MRVGSLFDMSIPEMEGKPRSQDRNVRQMLQHDVFGKLIQTKNLADDLFERTVSHVHRFWCFGGHFAVPVAMPAPALCPVSKTAHLGDKVFTAAFTFEERVRSCWA